MHGKLPAMWRVLAVAVAIASGVAACGDNIKPPPRDVLAELQALPNVFDVTEMPTSTPGYHYYVLHFIQPVDHADPASPTFLQEVSLLHRDLKAPLVVWTSGYSDYYLDRLTEPASLLGGNQISIEHRYFGTSRPDPTDWTKLTIEQMADDEHDIVSALRTIYKGAAITSGGSKGGMTAVFYRRFFPDDVDGTVPYVAPISFGTPDTRYPAFIDTLGPTNCHNAIRALATDIIMNRRTAMEQRAQTEADQLGYVYSRIKLGPAVESAIEGLEWSFWQYYGVTNCPMVPPTTASDDSVWTFLNTISPVSESDDAQIAFFDAYYYQSYFQLGYPDDGTTYLKPYYMYTDADYAGALPTPTPPTYDGGAAMNDVAQFVAQGDRFVFVYGQWDPWTGGKFDLGNAADSLELIQAQGTHGSQISRLAAADKQAALAKLQTWTGVTPAGVMREEMPMPRVPALAHRLRLR